MPYKRRFPKELDDVLPLAGESFWTRSKTLALGLQSCTYCLGLGVRAGRAGSDAVCNCVLRAVFREVYSRFKRCASKAHYMARVSMESLSAYSGGSHHPGRTLNRRRAVWGLKNEEFIADFCLLSRRALTDEQYKIFTLHFLLGAEWKLCCQRFHIDRGEFFHEVYRIEQRLGRVFAETAPYSLWPVDEYFNSNRRHPVKFTDSKAQTTKLPRYVRHTSPAAKAMAA